MGQGDYIFARPAGDNRLWRKTGRVKTKAGRVKAKAGNWAIRRKASSHMDDGKPKSKPVAS